MQNAQIDPLNAEQIRQACYAMLSVARLHGLHPAETALIAEFWSSAPELGTFDPAQPAPFDPSHLPAPADRELVIDLCLACAFADGNYSAEEKAQLKHLADQLAVSEEVLTQRSDNIRQAFLGSLAHLPDSASVAALSKALS
ncbi:hypothetical protein NT239_10040 [Chitinibacter sp. SCUT-21]|uniref:TerB family tellurite resistance protein n=1 Tax=Chitinibacter sp. SCUT-21 TaxID=2970891 RepID=UPI0035A5C4C0